MHKAILAVAALCPMLIHAQANSPAQPQPAAQNTVLESRLATPKALGASTDGATPVATPARISSGVTFPKVIETAELIESSDWHWTPAESQRLAVVKVLVDKNGQPSQVSMIQSLGAGMDGDVLAAVKHYRFQPATLDRQPVPVEVHLTVRILSRLNNAGM
jgi:TonB family protein